MCKKDLIKSRVLFLCVHLLYVFFRLPGELQGSRSDVPDACFIRAPVGAAGALRCEVADTLSCLMVTGSEELVSRVIRVKVEDGMTFHFPAIVVVPFRACHRSSYRDVAVKMIDEQRRVSYITPVATEGMYGGQKVTYSLICYFVFKLSHVPRYQQWS